MKNYFISLSIVFLFLIPSAYSQNSFHQNQLIVDVSNFGDHTAANDFQKKLGAITRETKIGKYELWEFTSFPIKYKSDDGATFIFENVIQINGHTFGRAEVDNTSLNYVIDSPFEGMDPANYAAAYTPVYGCTDGVVSANCAVGTEVIKIAIIDSGISTEQQQEVFGGYQITPSTVLPNSGTNDVNGHGTQMAGIIAGTCLAAPENYELYPIKAINNNGSTDLFRLLMALQEAKDLGADLINLSLGYYPNSNDDGSVLEDMMEGYDGLFVVSAGNDGTDNDNLPYYPASLNLDNIVSIAASECQSPLASFSNYGDLTVDIAAPGLDVVAPMPNGDWVAITGTSPATAIVTAVLAQLATHQTVFDGTLLKCALMNGATYDVHLDGLLASDGYIDATTSLGVLNGGCSNFNPNFDQNAFQSVPTNTQAYPNPFQDNIELRWENRVEQEVEIILVDLLGRIIWTNKETHMKGFHKTNIPLGENHQAGIYHLQIKKGTAFETIKIRKQ